MPCGIVLDPCFRGQHENLGPDGEGALDWGWVVDDVGCYGVDGRAVNIGPEFGEIFKVEHGVIEHDWRIGRLGTGVGGSFS